MYTCKKATELIEKEPFEKLSFLTKVRMKMHLMMCGACSNYKKQSQTLSGWIKNQPNVKAGEPMLSEDSKKRIIENVKKKRANCNHAILNKI